MILNKSIDNIDQISILLQSYGQILLYIVLIIGLIFFITRGIIKSNSNNVTKGFIYIIVGGSLTLIFIILTIIDYASNKTVISGLFTYLSFIIVSLGYTLIFGLTNIVKGKRRYQRLNFKKIKPSVNRNLNQHIYVVYKCGGQVILKRGKDTVSGFSLDMNSNHLFKDELLNELNKKYNVKPIYDDLKELGVCTINSKKPDVYYCYLVEINSISPELYQEEVVDQYDVITLDFKDNDKQMVLRILMREEFKLYL